MPWLVYDYRDARLNNAVNVWLRGLQKPERIRMQQRIDRLRDDGIDLCPGLAGPLKESRHLYKIRVNGRVAPRLLLCKGPINISFEYTLLIGAFERDDELPKGVIEAAERYRLEIIANPERRCLHVRVAP